VPHTLVLLRHGESIWNAENLFTGWVDVPLSEKGRGEAERGGQQLKDAGLAPDVVHTSLLRRAITSARHSARGSSSPRSAYRTSWACEYSSSSSSGGGGTSNERRQSMNCSSPY
jgi:2,3-bisphosphoglycerate-dependent phosphoglycerate mutase